MSTTVQLPDVCYFLKRHLVDVFETMLSMKATLLAENKLPQYKEHVSGSVGFGGENVTGVVYIHMSGEFSKRAAAAMLGMTPEEITSDAEVNDVIGEVANMVTGGLKSWLCDSGADCAVSTPTIIRGASFAIEPMPDVQRDLLVFDCSGERVAVEVHIKFS